MAKQIQQWTTSLSTKKHSSEMSSVVISFDFLAATATFFARRSVLTCELSGTFHRDLILPSARAWEGVGD